MTVPAWFDPKLPWWQLNHAGATEYGALQEGFRLNAFLAGKTTEFVDVDGVFVGGHTADSTLAAIVAKFPTLRRIHIEISSKDTLTPNATLCNDTMVVTARLGPKRGYVQAVSYSGAEIRELKALIEPMLLSKPVGSVYAALQGDDGIYFSNIGVGGVTLERDNYSEAVLKDYDTIVESLGSNGAAGRFSILDGPPGTGKSFFLRGLMSETSKGAIVMIPPGMVEALSGPSMLAPILNLSMENNTEDAPIVLVLEDADACLVRRDDANIGAISSLLNLSDGVLGSVLNIRIVATTNAKGTDFDPAILRPGRLLRKTHIGALDPAHASRVYKRLCGKDREWVAPVTLSEVYAACSDPERPQAAEKGGRVGFGATY